MYHTLSRWRPGYLHVDSNIFSGIIYDMDTEYGNIVKMTIMRGKIHKYLGMTMD